MSVLHGSHACRSKVLSPLQHRRASLPPLRAVAANSNSALDLMMHSQRLAILNHADEELRQLCCTKTTPEEQAKCWEVQTRGTPVSTSIASVFLCHLPVSTCLSSSQPVCMKLWLSRQCMAVQGCLLADISTTAWARLHTY